MATHTPIALEEYLDNEATAQFRSEYRAGEVVAMSGASPKHDLIISNLTAHLLFCLRKKRCNLFSKDVLVHLPECEAVYYPDFFVVCGKLKQLKRKRGASAIQNPSIVIKVLPDSTRSYDQQAKFACYKTLPSLQQYVLLHQDEVKAEVYDKEKNWQGEEVTNENVAITILGCSITLQEIYEAVDPEVE